MAIQTVFQRYEMKYLLTPDQKEAVLRAMQPYMEPDRYGRTSIRNLYYDTDNYRLIRRSLLAPSTIKSVLTQKSRDPRVSTITLICDALGITIR